MAFFETDDLSKVFVPPTGAGGAVLPIIGKPGGGGISVEAGAHGGLAVEFVAGAEAAATTQLPATIGQKAAAASLSIVEASDSGLATSTKQDEMAALADEVTGGSKAYSADGTLTKSDVTEYDPPLKVVWATGAGDITAMLADDTASVVTFAVDANERVSEFRIKKIMAATTATGLSGAQ